MSQELSWRMLVAVLASSFANGTEPSTGKPARIIPAPSADQAEPVDDMWRRLEAHEPNFKGLAKILGVETDWIAAEMSGEDLEFLDSAFLLPVLPPAEVTQTRRFEEKLIPIHGERSEPGVSIDQLGDWFEHWPPAGQGPMPRMDRPTDRK